MLAHNVDYDWITQTEIELTMCDRAFPAQNMAACVTYQAAG